jgi:hypothetical protein
VVSLALAVSYLQLQNHRRAAVRKKQFHSRHIVALTLHALPGLHRQSVRVISGGIGIRNLLNETFFWETYKPLLLMVEGMIFLKHGFRQAENDC